MAKTTVIDFWAPWCGPCKIMSPVIKEIEAENPELEVKEINVDEHQDIASQYGVMSIPTFVVQKDGKEVGRKVGVTSKQDLVALIKG